MRNLNVRMISAMLSLVLLAGLLPGGVMAQSNPPMGGDNLVNLDHLRFLTEPVMIDGREMAIVHIYSEHPEFTWVDAAGEGISAVDDVARAAVVYLWAYERTGDPELLDLARQTLNFVLYMQANDGQFYNFVYDREGEINLTGSTSYKSLGWWAMRGLWALGEGVRIFDDVDPGYADELAEAYLLTETALSGTLDASRPMTNVHGFEMPAWILGGEPAVASIGVLGMAAYYQARPNETTAFIITELADGIVLTRQGTHSAYPFGMHPIRTNAPGYWHLWGAHAPHALIEAGMALDRPDWIQAAADEAESFLLRQLALQRFRHTGVIPYRLEQIAYGTNSLVQVYMGLYEATGEERYAQLGGLAASWYFGNNMAGVPMYDPESGRTFDGINGPVSYRVNRNSGAESTIEGLMSMIAVADVPQAVDMLPVEAQDAAKPYLILEAEDGQRVNGTPIYYAGDWTGEGHISAGRYVGIGEGQRMRYVFEVEREDDYLLYVAHMREPVSSSTFTIQHTDAPPTIDGDLADWPDDLPELASDTQRQFLRGAGVWQGPEVDSHRIKLLWDDANLYLQAVVRDPEHDQPYTLSTVWQGDTLWLYLTNSPDARRLSAKITLAQTPDGPQLWDWVNTRFVPGAVMAFVPENGGYTYEVVIPWEALDVDAPQAGDRIGLESGRGIGGASFMDLTGRDPDVAANLLQLVLVDEDTDLGDLSAPEVSLEVKLDDGDPIIVAQTVSPDSEHFWLDLVTPLAVRLTPGEHIIRYRYVGESAEANPGLSKVDAFYLQPAVAVRVFAHPDGRTFTLTYDTVTGISSLVEE